jgi:hypothetical protein
VRGTALGPGHGDHCEDTFNVGVNVDIPETQHQWPLTLKVRSALPVRHAALIGMLAA